MRSAPLAGAGKPAFKLYTILLDRMSLAGWGLHFQLQQREQRLAHFQPSSPLPFHSIHVIDDDVDPPNTHARGYSRSEPRHDPEQEHTRTVC